MFGDFLQRIFHSGTTTAPPPLVAAEVPVSLALAPQVLQSTGIPNSDGATSGFRPSGQAFIAHPFQINLEQESFFEELPIHWLTKPRPHAILPPGAFTYSERWFALWEHALAPQFTTVTLIDAGQHTEAVSSLARWEVLLNEIQAKLETLGSFHKEYLLARSNTQLQKILSDYVAHIWSYMNNHTTPLPALQLLAHFYIDRNIFLDEFYYACNHKLGTSTLDPIAGVHIHDFIAATEHIRCGADTQTIITKLHITQEQWDRACSEWPERLAAFSKRKQRGSRPPMERLLTDRSFYIEVAATANVATEAGIPPERVLHHVYGLSTSDVNGATVVWMSDIAHVAEMLSSIEKRQAEFAVALPAEFGIANDIQF